MAFLESARNRKVLSPRFAGEARVVVVHFHPPASSRARDADPGG
jgi:hypothetical protein